MFREFEPLRIACAIIILVVVSNGAYANDVEVCYIVLSITCPIFKIWNKIRFIVTLGRDPKHTQIIGRF